MGMTMEDNEVIDPVMLLWNATNSSGPAAPYEHFKLQSRFICQRIVLPLLCTIGIVVNSLTILVFSHRKLQSSTNTYLRALGFCDLTYLASVLILTFENYPHRHPGYLYYLPFGYFLTDFMSNASVWLTAAFTVERFLVVSSPMKHMKYANATTAKRVILLVLAACFILTLPTIFERKVVRVPDPMSNSTSLTTLQLEPTEMGANLVYQNVYFWCASILWMFIPFAVIASLNVFLILSLRAAGRIRNSLTPSAMAANEHRTTFLLVVIIVLFLVCQLPSCIMLIVGLFQHDIPENLIRGINNIFNVLVVINACSNFFLYVGLSVKFRRTFIQLLFSRAKLSKFFLSPSISRRPYQPTPADANMTDNPHPPLQHRLTLDERV